MDNQEPQKGILIATPKSFATEGSADRNKASQADALRKYLTRGHRILELASGFGEAISYIASSHPDINFVPTDPQEVCLQRLDELSRNHDNMDRPVELNVFLSSQWETVAEHGPFNGILVFNLLHLIPWEGTSIVLDQSSQLLVETKGFLAIHGPFMREGMFMSTSDRKFDEDIKLRDERWGLRDLEEVVRISGGYGFKRADIMEMRAGNWMLILRRQ